MKQIRNSVFETNSSSVHSLTMCSSEEYEKFKNGDMYYISYGWGDLKKGFIEKDKAIDYAKLKMSEYYSKEEIAEWDEDEYEEKLNETMGDESIENYENRSDDCYETFVEKYTTAAGEEVIAFGYYGHD